MTGELLSWLAITFNDAEFWQACGAILTAYATYFALVFYAAAAQITFASDNRSTRLRVIMLVQHLLFVGWMAWLWIAVEQRRLLRSVDVRDPHRAALVRDGRR